MTGAVTVCVKTPRVEFDLVFDRNISVIRGFSGTGKSLLCDLLQRAADGEDGIDVTVSTKKGYIVMPAVTENSTTVQNWKDIIAKASDTIIFIDEMCDCLRSGVFSNWIQGTTNYYVIVSRKLHSELPYSIDAVYYFDDSQISIKRNRITNKELYTESTYSFSPSLVVTEDAGSGLYFFNKLFTVPIESSKSKTRVVKKAQTLAKQGNNNVIFIVDNAAFGDTFDTLCRYLNSSGMVYGIYAPESFEWLLLHSIVFKKCQGINEILNNYLDIIDWSKYFSAERFFIDILEKYSKELNLMPYDKSHKGLDPNFLTFENLEHIKAIIPFTIEASPDITNYFG